MIGQTIAQYKILEKLGAGGMGEVFLAEDANLHRKVALKFLPDKLNSDPEFKSRFEHEARAAAALNHPNIITVYDLGEHDGRMYIAMEHVTGKTLGDLIEANQLDVSKSIELAIQICDGLGAAHEAGIVHRDIKPANIIVDDRGRARILDFGLAKSHRATTETKIGSTVGTVQYESPEQSRGEPVDSRSDLFSFGAVLYEMLTGKLPFPGDYDAAVRYSISHEPIEPLARYKSGIPVDLENVVSKLLEKEPEMRYPAANGVIADLKRIERDLTHSSSTSRITQPSGISRQSAEVSQGKSMGKKFILPGSLVVVLLALALVFKPWKFEISPTQEAQAHEDRLAIMYFDNLADPGDTQRQGEIVANLLIADISASTQLKVASSQRLYDILKLLGHEGIRQIDRTVASQVAEKAEARWMLTGSILRTEPNVVLTSQLIEVETGNILASSRIDGAVGEDVFLLVDKLTDDILTGLNLSAESLNESPDIGDLTTTSPEAYRYYLEGWEMIRKMKTRDARPAFENAIRLDSNFAMAYYGLSFVAESSNEQDAAIARAVELSDGISERDRLFILARDSERKERFVALADPERTVALFTEIIEKFPDEKEPYSRLGQYYFISSHRNVNKSIELLNRVIELDPLEKSAYSYLAYANHYAGNLERAFWAINKYVELAPDEANAYDTRADLFAMNGRVDNAIADYRKAIAVDPNFVESAWKLAHLNLYNGNVEAALRTMREGASLPIPEARNAAHRGLVHIALYLGKLKEAEELMRHNITSRRIEMIDTNRHWLLDNEMGWFFIDLWKLTQDKAWLDSALALKPTIEKSIAADTTSNKLMPFYSYYRFRAFVGDFFTADSLMQASKSRLDTTVGWMVRFYRRDRAAIAYYKGEYDTAAYYADQMNEVEPRFPSLVEAGRAYFLAGKLAEAVTTLERAAKQFDSYRIFPAEHVVGVYYWLGRAYEESGWNDRAIEQYEKVVDIRKDADPGIVHNEDSKKRLGNLKS